MKVYESGCNAGYSDGYGLVDLLSRLEGLTYVFGGFEALDNRMLITKRQSVPFKLKTRVLEPPRTRGLEHFLSYPNIVFSTPVIVSSGVENGLFNPGISRFAVSLAIAFPVAVGDIRYDWGEHSTYVRE